MSVFDTYLAVRVRVEAQTMGQAMDIASGAAIELIGALPPNCELDPGHVEQALTNLKEW